MEESIEKRIEKLEEEKEELKKVVAHALNCIAILANATSFSAMLEIESTINYFNNSEILKNQD